MQLSTADRTLDESTLPTKAELNQIKPGDFARLQTKSGSRFWARVIGKRPNGLWDALTEDNIPSIGMKCGQLVIFDKSNVFDLS